MNRRPGRRPLTAHDRITKWCSDGKIQLSESGCWLWQGSTNGQGYAQANMSAKVRGGSSDDPSVHVVVHRFIYEHHIADVPAGLDLDHLCRVRHCVNPWHLEPVTRSVNLQRAVGIGIQWSKRTECSNGHEYTPDNTARAKRSGARVCRECRRNSSRRHSARKRGDAV